MKKTAALLASALTFLGVGCTSEDFLGTPTATEDGKGSLLLTTDNSIQWDAFDVIHEGDYTTVAYDTQNDGQYDVWSVDHTAGEYWLYDTDFDGTIDQMKVRREGPYFNTTLWIIDGHVYAYAEDTNGDGQPDLHGIETADMQQDYSDYAEFQAALQEIRVS